MLMLSITSLLNNKAAPHPHNSTDEVLVFYLLLSKIL